VQAVIAAFDRVNLVALGERNHLSVKEFEFRLRLIQDPAFARKVNDIVIEFANPIHQSILDRFVEGENIPREALDPVWTVYKQKSAYAPFYQQFVDAVRILNRNLPPGRRLRVIAGDSSGSRRNQVAADQIRREVLDKNARRSWCSAGSICFASCLNPWPKSLLSGASSCCSRTIGRPGGSLSKRCMVEISRYTSQPTPAHQKSQS
jgi:hypothetical protein